MFFTTKSRCLDQVQTPFSFVAIRYYGDDIKIHQFNYFH